MPAAKPVPLPVLELIAISRREPKTYQETHEQLLTLRHNIRVCTYLFAERLARIRDHELYLAADHASLEAYCAKEIPGISMRTLWKALAFADSIPGEVAAAYEPLKIDAGARLLKRNKQGDVLITKKALEDITIDAKREGKTVSVSFVKATPEELLAAAARRRKRALPEFPPELVAFGERCDRLFGSGVTRIAECRLQRQGSRSVLVITVAEDRTDEFAKLLTRK